jgi:hypothetical protein
MLTSLGLIFSATDPYIVKPKTAAKTKELYTNVVVRMQVIKVDSHIDFKE